MVTKLNRRRRIKLRVRRDLPDLSINPAAAVMLQFLFVLVCAVSFVRIVLSEDATNNMLLILEMILMLLACCCIVYGVWKLWTKLSANLSFPYILIACGAIAVLLLMVTYENELNNVNNFLFYYTSSTTTTMQCMVQRLANQAYTQCFDVLKAATRLILLVYNHFILGFLKIPWQVLNYVLNCANDIGRWFYLNVLQLLVLLHDNIPGGIPGIVLSFFVIILMQRHRRLSKTHNRCEADLLALENIKSKLQLEFEDIQSQMDAANQKIKKESEENRKLSSSLEEERDKRLCGICQDQIKTILLLPCNHLCLCKQCLDHKKWKNCPICRKGVQSTVVVYL